MCGTYIIASAVFYTGVWVSGTSRSHYHTIIASMVLGEMFLDTALKKRGEQLFLELCRIYPLSEVEDYCTDGCWDDWLMQAHYKLFFDHRETAGCPDPPGLNELQIHPMPTSLDSMVATTWPRITPTTAANEPAAVTSSNMTRLTEVGGMVARPSSGSSNTLPSQAVVHDAARHDYFVHNSS